MSKGGVLISENNKWGSIYLVKDLFIIKQGSITIKLDKDQAKQLQYALNELLSDTHHIK